MVECHARQLPELRNPDFSAFYKPESSPCTLTSSAWDRWKITEKVRRTIFLANMLNFYNNYDQSARKLSTYYTPIDDDLVLNMPLPSSEAAWSARDEEIWRLAMSQSPVLQTNSTGFESRLNAALSSTATLKEVFEQSTKEQLQRRIGSNFGLDNSDKFRQLIILCATEQFY